MEGGELLRKLRRAGDGRGVVPSLARPLAALLSLLLLILALGAGQASAAVGGGGNTTTTTSSTASIAYDPPTTDVAARRHVRDPDRRQVRRLDRLRPDVRCGLRRPGGAGGRGGRARRDRRRRRDRTSPAPPDEQPRDADRLVQHEPLLANRH